MFKFIRIVVLLIVLLAVWSTLQLQKDVTRDWQGSADVVIVPVVADADLNTQAYIDGLSLRNFAEITRYISREASRYRSDISQAISLSLAEPIASPPPSIPQAGANRLAIIWWSLRLRWWAWQHKPAAYHDSQVRLYVLYSSPEKNQQLPHSTGLQNGLIGLINARAFNNYQRINNVILTHELLHILGASDKYDLGTGRPIYPDGYADPDARPLHPQDSGEIMARSIALSETQFEVARSLSQTKVGRLTAYEIGWLKAL